MNNNTQKVEVTVPILGLLGLIFITLKLLGKITWSWWWVTAPFWGGFALLALFLVGVVAFVVGGTVVAWLLDKARGKRRDHYGRRW